MIIDKASVLNRYFALADRLPHDPSAYDELVGLFADNAVVNVTGTPVTGGRQKLLDLYRETFKPVADCHHHWTSTVLRDDTVQVVWATASRLHDGSIVATGGIEQATVNDQGLITRLHNDSAGILTPGSDLPH